METVVEIIAFLVVIAVLWWKVLPPLKKQMAAQKETIRVQLAESEKAKSRLEEAERKHTDAVAEARVEAAKIRDNARADAQRITEEMHAQAEAEVARIKQRGEEQLGLQRSQLIRELRAELGGTSVAEAAQLVRTHLEDPGARSASVDRFLGELEGMSGSQQTAAASSRGEA